MVITAFSITFTILITIPTAVTFALTFAFLAVLANVPDITEARATRDIMHDVVEVAGIEKLLSLVG